MTFSNVFSYIKNNEAAKTPSMLGYVKRVDGTVTDSEKAAGMTARFTLTFVENLDTGALADGTTTYPFAVTITNSVPTIMAPDTTLYVDGQLLALLASTDWTIIPLADAEAALTNKNTSRW